MKNALPSDADVKVIEISQADVPVGEIEFPTNALEPVTVNSGGVQLWRGSVHYAESRKMPIWARVSVTEHYTVVVAARDLNQNSVAPSNALRLEERTGPPPKEKFATRIADVAGKQIVRFVKTGDPIPSSAITEPWDVKRGDPVRVEVRSGDARLSLDGIAESSAREGDMLDVRNPSSGKLFRARLEQGSRAVVIVGPGPKL